MFSDDTLFERLVLKGGNALNLIYKFGSRASIDVDFSLDGDFNDLEDTEERIVRALENRFAETRHTVFDAKLVERPATEGTPEGRRLSGYEVTFKLIETAKYGPDFERLRREAVVIGPNNQRSFKVQISKYEHCGGKREVELDNYAIRVYTPEMLAIEKLRAICQQMPEYGKRGHPTPRARDFYDIHAIVAATGVKLDAPENIQLVLDIFQAKQVDPALIGKVVEYREFHRPDWPSVRLGVAGKLEDFDFYFDSVVGEIQLLKSLWIK